MLSQFIGLIYEARTLKLRMVFNPDHDGQLLDPALTQAPDETRLIAYVPRAHDPRLQKAVLSAEDAAFIEKNATALLLRYAAWRR